MSLQFQLEMTAITESHVLHVAGSDGRSLSYLSQINEVDLQVVSDAIGKISSSPYVTEGQEKQPLVCIREILSNGENALLETTLRRLLGLVNSAAADIDANGHDNLDNKSFAEYQPKDLIVRRIVPIAAPMIEGMIMAPQIVCKSVAINLLQRDLRILDFDSHPSEKPSIRVRRHAVLFSVDPIRAIIMSTRILIIVPPGGMDQILEIVEKYMAGKINIIIASIQNLI